ncbi:hypothetical protein THAR02_02112 [Trichoderma harzianum]|uniref:Transcription factor domain-containing protein n=1 Tax=Trichoderma harzianum TaxID=5544 RepID=A0A0F9Y0V3_TRIHA|nr:hypothetical protein THAR02_02112 [Trichoderma harzianum]
MSQPSKKRSKNEPSIPLRLRRRGYGSIKSRNTWEPPNILPNVQQQSPSSPLSSPAPEGDGVPLSDAGSSMSRECQGFSTTSRGASSVSLVTPVVIEDALSTTPRPLSSEAITEPRQEAYMSLSPSSAQSHVLLDNTFDMILPGNGIEGTSWLGDSDFWEPTLPPFPAVITGTPNIPSQSQWTGSISALATPAFQEGMTAADSNSSTWPHSIQVSSDLPHLSSPILSLHFDVPDALNLDNYEKRALEYYQGQYTDLRSVKGFSWSAYSIFLTIALKEEVVLRLMLAVSLQGISHHSYDEGISLSSKANLNKGLKLLHRILLQEHPNHLVVMVSFWLLILCTMDNAASSTGPQRRDLSAKIHSYVITHRLYDRCSSAAEDHVVESNKILNNETAFHSLIYKLLGMLIYADVQLNFVSHGGKLSDLLLERGCMQRIRQISRNYLYLNHGNRYPSSELTYDIESVECYDVYHEQHRLYHLLNQLFWFGTGNHRSIQEEIDTLETIDAAEVPSPDIRIRDSVSSFLQIAHRLQRMKARYSWFDRSLFLVGIETRDAIHRDWIQGRMIRADLIRALSRVWEGEKMYGRRFSKEQMQIILRGEGVLYDSATVASAWQ